MEDSGGAHENEADTCSAAVKTGIGSLGESEGDPGSSGQYGFPSERGPLIQMSADTVRVAIRSLGFGPEQMTAHGFRSMPSTILYESGL